MKGNRVSIQTDFGISLSMNGYDVRLRIPNPPYGSMVEGLCGNNNDDRTDDYQTRARNSHVKSRKLSQFCSQFFIRNLKF